MLMGSAQIPCNTVPSTEQILKSLSKKPVTGVYHNHFIIGCNVTDSIRKRILYLLNWQWTKDEIENYLTEYVAERKDFYRIEKRASEVSKGNDSLYKKAKDSIINMLKSERFNYLKSYFHFKVDDGLILAAANLYYTEATPILQQALKDSIHYNPNIVELALARIGDKTLRTKIIDNCVYRKDLNGQDWIEYYTGQIAGKLLFIASQESIFKLNQWLDTSKIYRARVNATKPDTKNAYNVINDLKNIILNKEFQAQLEKVDSEPVGQMANGPILFCKEWLIKNVGKYKINSYYCPY